MSIGYYFYASYRRKLIDKLQEKNKGFYRGTVLDIGGRDRGIFRSPKDKVERWITADIEPSRKPDMVLDVADMNGITAESIDVVNAIELFEHVEKINDGLKECSRVLKRGGLIIISVPFLFPIHADPYDFQRWTEKKWRDELDKREFSIQSLDILGKFFTVSGDMLKAMFESLPPLIRHLQIVVYPLIDLIVSLDNIKAIREHRRLGKYHGGYFIIAKKK